jgi:hypothetical protein
MQWDLIAEPQMTSPILDFYLTNLISAKLGNSGIGVPGMLYHECGQ